MGGQAERRGPEFSRRECDQGAGWREIYLNHRAYTRVVTDPEHRNSILEELPLSTRVHELAKELGLKSAELLERILSWGLDVKASNFASLDQATVDRIRDLSARSASGQAGASSGSQGARPAGTPAQPAVSAAPQPSRPSSKDSPPPKSAGISPPTSPVASSSPSSSSAPQVQARSEPAARGPAAGSQVLAPGSSPAAAPVAKATSAAPAGSPGAPRKGDHTGRHGRLHPRRPHSRGTADSRARDLVAGRCRRTRHIEDRALGRTRPAQRLRAGWSRGVARRARSGGNHGRGARRIPAIEARGLHVFGGIRTMTPRVSPAPPPSSQSRRPAGESGGESGRRDSGGSGARKGPPLPQVAAASAPRPSPSPSRPTAPGPALKTQRPDKSMTKDELLRLMKTGQLGHLQSPGGGGTAAPGVGERSGHQERPGGFPGAPRGGSAPLPGGPAVRRPGSPPGPHPVAARDDR